MSALTHLRRAAMGALILSFLAAPVPATTLTDALIQAYQLSPLLDASRAGLRAQDETVAQARAAKRPQISAGAAAGVQQTDGGQNSQMLDNLSASINASLNIFDNGQTAAAIEAAKAGIAASRANLRETEQTVLLNTVEAFMNVRRDLQFVSVAQNNVRVLQEQVRATADRFELGEVTRTDVSLAEARLAGARASLASFEGQLEASRQLYRAVVGVAPANLRPPPPIPALPRSLAEAEALAINESPILLAARFAQTEAEFNLRRAERARGISVDLSGSASIARSERGLITGGTDRSTGRTLSAEIGASVPLYLGGELSSVERQAGQLVAQRKFQVQDTARAIRQGVANAWSGLEVARATVVANQSEVEAAQVAFEGVREEALLGARTTLDVLDREQELRDAQVQLASSQRDAYVAAYQLLAAVGLMTVEHLGLGIPEYNPDINYSRVQSGPFTPRRDGLLETLGDRYSR